MLSFRQLYEASYQNNIGFEELVRFYKQASRDESAKMDKIVASGDWSAFKKLVKIVIGVALQ